MVNYLKKNFFFFYIFLLIIFLTLTTKHYDYQSTLIYGGADGFYYMQIAKSSPYFTETKITLHYAQRFLLPYIIGLISKLSGFDLFFVFKLTSFITLIILSFTLVKIIKIFTKDKFYQIIILNLVLLNPYISRFYISVPTVINDLFFLTTTALISLVIIKKKNILYIFYSCLSLTARQTGVVFLISAISNLIVFKRKSIINLKLLIIMIIGYYIFFSLIIFYSKNSSNTNFDYTHINGIFFYLINKFNILNLINFISLPFLSYGLLLLFIFFFLKLKKNFSTNKQKIFIIFLSILLIISQPILAGPELTGRNIIRLSTLAYVLVISLLTFIYREKKILNNYKILFIIIQIICSFHPTFSILKNLSL